MVFWQTLIISGKIGIYFRICGQGFFHQAHSFYAHGFYGVLCEEVWDMSTAHSLQSLAGRGDEFFPARMVKVVNWELLKVDKFTQVNLCRCLRTRACRMVCWVMWHRSHILMLVRWI